MHVTTLPLFNLIVYLIGGNSIRKSTNNAIIIIIILVLTKAADITRGRIQQSTQDYGVNRSWLI